MKYEIEFYEEGSKVKFICFITFYKFYATVAHFNEQFNKSRYIWELVREDMQRTQQNDKILEIVRQAMNNTVCTNTNVNNFNEDKNVDNFNKNSRKKSVKNLLQP